jgi:iron complex outermembrane recepter protein
MGIPPPEADLQLELSSCALTIEYQKELAMPTTILKRFALLSLLAGATLTGYAGISSAEEPAARDKDLEEVVVLGSRIPRLQKEGPAPVTVIDAEAIRSGGYATIADVLRTVSQNSGEVQSQQSFNAADFSPGGQQVDLRGLGSNHTLVLINGRRVADFPMPFNGRSNFTDVGSIPLSMVQDIEILSGAASAIYGSDAIAGVVNFKLKQSVDAPTLEYRYGREEHGGGQSQLLNGSIGFDAGRFHGVVGGEWLHKDPLWAYRRSRQDSTLDNPVASRNYARRNYMRIDIDEYYIDPGQATCDGLAGQNFGTTFYALREDWGNYCGSNQSIGYGTIESQRDQLSGISSLVFDLSESTHLFADIQASRSEVRVMNDVLSWFYMAPDGNEEGYFYNSDPGVDQYDNWNRIFSPEESGGLENAMRTVNSTSYSLTSGLRGTFGARAQWGYELAGNLSRYSQRISFPQVIADRANAFFLGDNLGPDTAYGDYGYPVFNAPVSRFYTPLTPAEYNSITAKSIYHPHAWLNNLSATINTGDLFEMPAGSVGFAAVAEAGRQNYDLSPDPKALEYYYLGWKDSAGKGGRDHAALGTEFSVPLLSTLKLSLADRYDRYNFAGNSVGKFTYNAGLEFRPAKSLLLRSAYGTAFRAPDLHYVFTGPGNTHPSADDWYLCRINDQVTGSDISNCDFSGVGIVANRDGNRRLKPETGDSLTIGFVWSPSSMFDINADYFRINMADQVEDLSIDGVLRSEADCRIGSTQGGTPVDPASPTCVDALARVHRYVGGIFDGEIQSVAVNPVNVAKESTSGIDMSTHVHFNTAIGKVAVTTNYTHVLDHTYTRYVGDRPLDKLAFDSNYYIPRDKLSGSVSLSKGSWKFNIDGNYTSRLPNYDEDGWLASYVTYNGSVSYDIDERIRVSVAIDNLGDASPPFDPTWRGYPYYNDTWYDGVGRSGFLQVTYKFR